MGADPVNYGSGNVREPYVKTVVVPIKQAQKLFPSREKSSPPEYLNALKNEIEKGRKIAPPFLDVEVPKKGSALLVKNHEGAHRIAVLRSLGYEYVPIDIISNVKLRGVEGDKIYKRQLFNGSESTSLAPCLCASFSPSVEDGDILLFPPYLEHSVESQPQHKNNMRMTFSFNIALKS